MKILKPVIKIGEIMHHASSGLFYALFDMLFGPFNADSMMDMYCNEDYYMTSGGVMMRKDQQA